MTFLHVINIPEEEAHLSKYLDFLSDEEKLAADRFVRYSDRLCYIVTRGSLRTLVGEALEQDPIAIQIEYAEKGKPRIASSLPTSLFFNASHSGEYSIIAINREFELGVDIEQKRRIRDLDGLASRFFTDVEYQEFKDADDDVAAFFSIWTLKEAIVKLTGKGISGGLSKFDVSLKPSDNNHLKRLENEDWSLCETSLIPFSFNEDYASALAVATKADQLKIDRFSLGTSAVHEV